MSETYLPSEMAEAILKIPGGNPGVNSFNERTGAVVPQSGDYTAAMVGADESGAAAAVQSSLSAHTSDTTVHITAAERTTWNGKPNPNLLDNWYFPNPVNQRGQTEYTGAGYAIDRWLGRNSETSITVKTDCIRVATSFSSGVRGAFDQKIENFSALSGKTVTFSMLFEENTGSLAVEILADNSSVRRVVSTAANGLVSVTATLPDTISSRLDVVAGVGPNAGADLYAGKLELGDTQTLAHQDSGGNWVLNEIPDYGTELAKCQRYQLALHYYQARATAVGTNRMYFLIPLPVTLRTTPTLSGSLAVVSMDNTIQSDFSFVTTARTNGLLVESIKTAHGLSDGFIRAIDGVILDANL